MSIGHHPRLQSLEICLNGAIHYTPLEQLRSLFSASTTRLPMLQELTLNLDLRNAISPGCCFAYLPFEPRSCVLMHAGNPAYAKCFVTEATPTDFGIYDGAIVTYDVAPSLQVFKVDLQGPGMLVVYPCSVFLNTLWKPGNLGMIKLSHSGGDWMECVG
jgi:hypothetical protein